MPKSLKSLAFQRRHKLWHLHAGYTYLAICGFDFVVFPALALATGKTWTPLTIQGGGIFHFAFGGILGFGTWAFHRQAIGGSGA